MEFLVTAGSEGLGRGTAYPLRRSSRGGILPAEGLDYLRMSIQQLLEYDPFEQPFDVRNGVPMGAGLLSLTFEDAQHAMELGGYRIRTVLEEWEPRVRVLGVDANTPADATAEGVRTVQFVVRYEVRATGSVGVATVDAAIERS